MDKSYRLAELDAGRLATNHGSKCPSVEPTHLGVRATLSARSESILSRRPTAGLLQANAPRLWKRLQTHLGQAIQYLVLMLVVP